MAYNYNNFGGRDLNRVNDQMAALQKQLNDPNYQMIQNRGREAEALNQRGGLAGWGRASQQRMQQYQQDTAAANAANIQRQQAMRQLQDLQGQQRVAEARSGMYGLASDRRGEVRGDPTDQMVLQELQGRVRGTDAPYNEEAVNALMSGASDQASAAEAALAKRLPGRPGTPAYDAARRELMAGRQGQVQGARQQIHQRANLANFDAVTQALGQTMGFNDMRQSRITDADRYLADLLRRETYIDNRNTGAY